MAEIDDEDEEVGNDETQEVVPRDSMERVKAKNVSELTVTSYYQPSIRPGEVGVVAVFELFNRTPAIFEEVV